MGWVGLDGVFSPLSPMGVMPWAGGQWAWRAAAAAALWALREISKLSLDTHELGMPVSQIRSMGLPGVPTRLSPGIPTLPQAFVWAPALGVSHMGIISHQGVLPISL